MCAAVSGDEKAREEEAPCQREDRHADRGGVAQPPNRAIAKPSAMKVTFYTVSPARVAITRRRKSCGMAPAIRGANSRRGGQELRNERERGATVLGAAQVAPQAVAAA